MKRVAPLALTLALLAGCDKSETQTASPPPQVYTMTAKEQSAPLRRQFTGRVSAYQSANVVARVSGVLLKRLYREGDDVRKGQKLFQIDPAYYQAQLDNDVATLAEDQATLADAKVTAERARALLHKGFVPQQTVDDANAAERKAAAKIQADQAMIESARLNLNYTNVVAPIDGVAGQQQVTAGALVGNGANDSGAGGTLLTMIEQIDPVYVNFTMSTADLTALRLSQSAGRVELADQDKTKIEVELPNGAAYGQSGTLDYSGVLVNSTTGAVDMRAVVPNADRILLPGMYVALTADLGRQNKVFLVSQLSVQRDATGAYVLVVTADSKVARKVVTASDSYGNDWIITHGLAEGDQVIVSGLQRAREGQKVDARAWRAPAPDDPNAVAAQR
jgi:membrane fusion protein, multidrug efflux system